MLRSNLRILHVNEYWGPYGGTEQDILNMANGLAQLGCVNLIAYRQRSGEWPTQPNMPEAMIAFDQGDAASDTAAGLLKQFDPDAILLHNVSDVHLIRALSGLRPTMRKIHDHRPYCLRKSRMLPGETICRKRLDFRCMLYGCIIARPKPGRLAPVVNSLARRKEELRATMELTLLFAGSNFMKDELLKNGVSAEKIAVIPMGVKKPVPTRIPNTCRKTILYVGQIERAKGLHYLIQAVALLDDKQAKLVVAGVGGFQSSCQALISQLGISNRVRLLGWVQQEQMAGLYRHADVIVVPSIWPEPFGLVGIEAMAHGKPVIAFNVGGISDWLRDRRTGLLVAEKNVRDLAIAIKELLDNPKLAQNLGANARIVADEEYSLELYSQRTLQAIKKCLACAS